MNIVVIVISTQRRLNEKEEEEEENKIGNDCYPLITKCKIRSLFLYVLQQHRNAQYNNRTDHNNTC